MNSREDQQAIDRALADKERGLGSYHVRMDAAARRHLAKLSDGDARKCLNALEIGVLTTPPDNKGVIHFTLPIAEDTPWREAAPALHAAILNGLVDSVAGKLPTHGPRGGKRWTARYFVRRAAWHVLDHVWEIEDRRA